MLVGLAAMLLSVYAVVSSIFPLSSVGQMRHSLKDLLNTAATTPVLLLIPAIAVFHAMGAFSDNFIAGEHWVLLALMLSGVLYLAVHVVRSERLPRDAKVLLSALLAGMAGLVCIVWGAQVFHGAANTSHAEHSNGGRYVIVCLLCSALVSHCLWRRLFKAVGEGSRLSVNTTQMASADAHLISHLLLICYWCVRDGYWTVTSSLIRRELVLLQLPKGILLVTATVLCGVLISHFFFNSHADRFDSRCSAITLLCVLQQLSVLVSLFSLGPVEALQLSVMCVHVALFAFISECILCAELSVVDPQQRSEVVTVRAVTAELFYFLAGRSSSALTKLLRYKHSDRSAAASRSYTNISQGHLVNVALYLTAAGRFQFFVTGHRMDFGKLQVSFALQVFVYFH